MSPSPRPEIELAVGIYRGFAMFNTIVVGTLMVCNFLSIYENRRQVSFRSVSQAWRMPLCAATVTSFIVLCLASAMKWADWTGNLAGCQATAYLTAYVRELTKVFA